MKLADLYIGAIVEELMCDGPIGSGKVTPMVWQRARVTAIVKRKSQFYPLGHVKVSVLRADGSIAVRDEVPIDQLAKYLRLPQATNRTMAKWPGSIG